MASPSTCGASRTSIAWSCVSRDGTILAEAGEDDGKGKVLRTARRISMMKPTAGWEKCWTLKDAPFRGLKLHLYEVDDEEETMVWSYSCVYNQKSISEDCAKAFLSKLLAITEPLRLCPWWLEGGTLAAQPSFAPTLQQQLETWDEHDAKLFAMNQQVEETKQIMADNIESMFKRGERLEDLQDEAHELSQMSRVFKKSARKVKRAKAWANAKYGVMVGTAVTGAAAVVIVPPLIALL